MARTEGASDQEAIGGGQEAGAQRTRLATDEYEKMLRNETDQVLADRVRCA